MSINWAEFTPWSSLAGGLLIGLAAALFIVLNGRIAGISGVIGGLLRPASDDLGWRIAFVSGLLMAPLVYRWWWPLPATQNVAGYPLLIVAGLLVGIGSRYGAGCTSGHGVCGLARGSPRSLVATVCFMASGFIVVYLTRHVLQG